MPPAAVRSHVAAGGGTPEHRPVTIAFVHFEETDKLIEHEGVEAAAERLDRLVSIVQGRGRGTGRRVPRV